MPDPFESYASTPASFGTLGTPVTPDDGTDLEPFAKTVVVTSTTGGSVLQVLPNGNADGAWITFTGVQVGYCPPFRVRRVGTGTTCDCVSVSG